LEHVDTVRCNIVDSLSVHECLDVETQGGADTHDVLAIELLEDCGLASVVQAPWMAVCDDPQDGTRIVTYKNRMRISFSFCLLLRMIVRRPMNRRAVSLCGELKTRFELHGQRLEEIMADGFDQL
jgi:hypothetical protein